MEVLKRRLKDKVSEIQRDAATVQVRLDEQARLQTILDRWRQKLQADLDRAFSHLHELIEQRKKELTTKVDKVIASGRRAFTQQNTNCNSCLVSVDKVSKRVHYIMKHGYPVYVHALVFELGVVYLGVPISKCTVKGIPFG